MAVRLTEMWDLVDPSGAVLASFGNRLSALEYAKSAAAISLTRISIVHVRTTETRRVHEHVDPPT